MTDVALSPEAQRLLRPDEPALWVGKPDATLWMLSHAGSVVLGTAVLVPFVVIFLPLMLANEAAPPLFRVLFPLFFLVPIVLFVGGTLLRALLGHRRVLYVFTPRRIILQRGIIGRDFEIIDRARVTDYDLRVGLWDRLMGRGTGTVRIRTASEGAQQHPYRRGAKSLLHVPNAYDVQARLLEILDRHHGRAR